MERELTDGLVEHWMKLVRKECGHEHLSFETEIYDTQLEDGIVSLKCLDDEVVLTIYVIYDDFFIAMDQSNYCVLFTIRPGYNMVQTVKQATRYYRPAKKERHKRSIPSCYAYSGSDLFERTVMTHSNQFKRDYYTRSYKFVGKYSTGLIFGRVINVYVYSVGKQLYLFATPFSESFERVDTSDSTELTEFRARGLDYIIRRERPMFLGNILDQDVFTDLLVCCSEN